MTKKINKNVKKWIKALRSGKYKQLTTRLARGRGNDRAYCCLGVACDIYKKEHPSFRYNGAAGYLPERVRKWLKLKTASGELSKNVMFYNRRAVALVQLNDNYGASFEQIADVIENHYEALIDE